MGWRGGDYPITDVITHGTKDQGVTYLTLTDPDNKNKLEFIETTPEHPFFVAKPADAQPRPAPEGHSDLSRNWVGAGHLKIGDTIKQADGTTGLVANVTTAQQTREMFNLTVSEAHTYYVGQDGWLVHNCPDAGDAAKAFTQPGWIKKDLYSELSKTLDKDVLKKFEDGLSSFTSGQGGTGIKKLSGGGVKIGGTTYEYELKILGKGGGGRIYGNRNENGQVIFEIYRPQH